MDDLTGDIDQAADEAILDREISDAALEVAAGGDLAAQRSMINSLLCDPLHC